MTKELLDKQNEERPPDGKSAFLARLRAHYARPEETASAEKRERPTRRRLIEKLLGISRRGGDVSNAEGISAEEEVLATEIFKQFRPSVELGEQLVTSEAGRAEAEVLWEETRGEKIDEAVVSFLREAAQRHAIANNLARAARVTERKEYEAFLEGELENETRRASRRGSAKIPPAYRHPPLRIPIEDAILAREERAGTAKTDSERRRAKILRNIKNFIGLLRVETVGDPTTRRYAGIKEYGTKIDALGEIAQAEDITMALQNARERKIISEEEFEELTAHGPTGQEGNEQRKSEYINNLNLRYVSEQIDGETWDRLRATAEAVFSGKNSHETIELAYAGGEISEEEKIELLRYVPPKKQKVQYEGRERRQGEWDDVAPVERAHTSNPLAAKIVAKLESSRMDPATAARLVTILKELGDSKDLLADLRRDKKARMVNAPDFKTLVQLLQEVEAEDKEI